MGEEKESPTTIFPFANVLPAWSQPQPNSELGSRLAAARSFALPQICPTVWEELSNCCLSAFTLAPRSCCDNAAGLLC
jgi:hypothetical protein